MRRSRRIYVLHLVIPSILLCAVLSGCQEKTTATQEATLRANLATNPDDAESRMKLAGMLYDAGERQSVVQLLEEGVRRSPDHVEMRRQLARTYTWWAWEAKDKKRFKNAQAHWEYLIDAGDGDAEAHYQLGYTLNAMGLRAQSVGAYAMAAKLEPENASYRAEVAFAYKETGKYETALPLIQDLVNECPDNFRYRLWLGDACRLLGDYDEALAHMQKALELSPPEARAEAQEYVIFTQRLTLTDKSWHALNSHIALADRHREKSRPDREAAEYERVVEVCPDDPGAYGTLGWSYLCLSQFASHVGNVDESIEYAKKSIEFYTKSGNKTDMAFAYQALGNIFWAMAGDSQDKELYAKALNAYEREHECATDAGHILMIIFALSEKANAMQEVYGIDDPRTRECREQLQKFLPKRGEKINEAKATAAYSEVLFLLEEENFEGARELLEMIFEFYCRNNDIRGVKMGPFVLNMLTTIALREDDYDTAIAYGQRAVDRLIAIRSLLGADEFRRKVGGDIWKRAFAENLVQCALAKSDPIAAFNYSEQYKGRALLDLLGSQASDSRRVVVREKRREQQTLVARVENIEQQIEEVKVTNEQAALRSLERTLSIEKTNYERLKEDVAVAEQEIRCFEQVDPISLEEVQELAAAHNFTFVTYVVGNWGTAATVVTKDGVHAVALKEATQAALAEAMLACLPGLGLEISDAVRDLSLESDEGTPQPDTALSAEEALDQNSELLYSMLIEPVLPYIDTEIVYISPDAALNRVPFEALKKSGTYFAEQFAIDYVPSASVLRICLDKAREAREAVLALGNPNLKNPAFRLVHAENEVQGLEGLFTHA